MLAAARVWANLAWVLSGLVLLAAAFKALPVIWRSGVSCFKAGWHGLERAVAAPGNIERTLKALESLGGLQSSIDDAAVLARAAHDEWKGTINAVGHLVHEQSLTRSELKAEILACRKRLDAIERRLKEAKSS
jgi:hypothetical protein